MSKAERADVKRQGFSHSQHAWEQLPWELQW